VEKDQARVVGNRIGRVENLDLSSDAYDKPPVAAAVDGLNERVTNVEPTGARGTDLVRAYPVTR
jgi:hypothetical protein